ncbi:MAG: pilus assembly protein TadG-related protein [Acetobacteraceae bacterium]
MRNRRGGIALATALAAIPLIAAAGLAVDGARAWLVSSRLQASLDAAALAGARNLNVTRTARDNEIRSMFWANFSAAIPDPLMPDRRIGFLGSSTATPTIRDRSDSPDIADTALEISVTAVVPTTFMRIFGIDTVRVAARAQARRADLGMELALVLDVTGSMGSNYRADSASLTDFNTSTNIHALRLASQDLITSLFGERRFVDGLWVSVVPWTTTVNLGSGRTGIGRFGINRSQGPNRLVNLSLLQASTTDFNHSWGQAGAAAYGPAGWDGCIEAPPFAPADMTDPEERANFYEAPPGPQGFRPFFYPSTLRFATIPANVTQHIDTLMRRDAQNRLWPGDNDWIPTVALAQSPTAQSPFAITEQWRTWRENNAVGPNLGCPQDEVLPLTADRDVIMEHVSRLRSSHRGGTMGNIGLQAGWWTLSPQWREIWDLGPPPPGQDTSLPLNYGTPFMRKVVVLMTDGVNEWYDFPGGHPGVCTAGQNTARRTLPGVPGNNNVPMMQPVACPNNPRAPDNLDANYTGYGRLLEGRVGTTNRAQATTTLNARMLELCDALKSRGIIIYTITFNLTNVNTQNLYRQCATSPDFYFNSPTQADLRAAFQTIGSQLANLRLTQ